MSRETLARIDATLVILDRAHKMSISSLDAPDDATTYGLAAVVLRESRALIPSPPTDDEREALDSVIRGALAPLHIDYTPWHRIVTVLLDAILSSPPWRNRHRGQITDAERLAVLRELRDQTSYDDEDYWDREAFSYRIAALEAAEAER